MDYPAFIKTIEIKNGFKVKVKGGSVGKPNEFNKNLIIIKKALVNHFIEHKTIYDTIRENQDLIDYQIIKKRTAKTKYKDMLTNTDLPDKVLRLFPVTQGGMQILTDTYKQIPDVPERTVLIKDDIRNKTINDIPNFDINYYIEKFNDELESWLSGKEEINEENI